MSLLEGTAGIALVIFALTYVVLGFGALPPLRVDRTGAALIGAVAMIGFGVLTPHAAVAAIDFDTIEKPGDTFTLRERDSMKQTRITEAELFQLLAEQVY